MFISLMVLKVAIPLGLLVNKGSASASEIIAGAVQDRKLGTIVGTNTYGKGTVQTIYPSLDNEGIKVTMLNTTHQVTVLLTELVSNLMWK